MRRSIRSATLALLVALAASTGARAQSPTPADSSSESGATTSTVPTLSNFNSFATIMNLARGTVRLVAVISPSSPDAETGLDVVTSILEDIPSKRLRAYVILSAASDEDSGARAIGFVARHRNPRVVYIWDPESVVASAMGPTAGIGDAFAFETYFLYDTDASFAETPPHPAMWMELSAYINGPPLEAAPLREKAEGMVRAVEKKAAQAGSEQ